MHDYIWKPKCNSNALKWVIIDDTELLLCTTYIVFTIVWYNVFLLKFLFKSQNYEYEQILCLLL